MIKTVIFDLDGTLLDTVSTIAYYCNTTLEKYGLTPSPVENYRTYTGNGAELLIRRALSYNNECTEENFDKVFSEYNRVYNNDPLYLTKPYNNIVNLLNELRKRNITIAVLSNKPDIATKEVVKSIFGEGLCTLCCGAKDGVPLKPDPTAVLGIMKDLNATTENSVFIGDTYVDIETGKNAGLTTIGVLWGFRDEEELKKAGADFFVSDALEILDVIEKL